MSGQWDEKPMIWNVGRDEWGNEVLIHPRNKKCKAVIDDIDGVYWLLLGQNSWKEWLYVGPFKI